MICLVWKMSVCFKWMQAILHFRRYRQLICNAKKSCELPSPQPLPVYHHPPTTCTDQRAQQSLSSFWSAIYAAVRIKTRSDNLCILENLGQGPSLRNIKPILSNAIEWVFLIISHSDWSRIINKYKPTLITRTPTVINRWNKGNPTPNTNRPNVKLVGWPGLVWRSFWRWLWFISQLS